MNALQICLCFLFQFPDVVSFCDQMADKGKIVIVAALDGTFQRQVSRFTFIMWMLLQENLILLYENNTHASLCTLTVYSASLSFSLLKVQ